MDPEFLSKTEEQEWIDRRVKEVGKVYSAFQALSEMGVEIPDESTSYQILCPFHGDKNKPSARFYASSGRHPSHFYCFKCKSRLDGVGIYAKHHSKRFFEALSELERRFGIKVPNKPDNFDFLDKSESKSWLDIERHLTLVENKLVRNRHKATMQEYIKICRLLDAVRWDFNQTGVATEPMVIALKNAASKIDEFNVDII